MLMAASLDFMPTLTRTMVAMSTETTNSTDELVHVLDIAEAMPGAGELRARSYDLLRLAADARVVDAGCGTGRAAAELVERGAQGVGVDTDERMIDLARQRWPRADFHSATVTQLPFGDGALSGYRADKVLHVLPDPKAAVAEARRVLESAGRIVLIGQDWDGVLIDSDDGQLTRTIVQARADALASPRAARGYHTMLRDAGFVELSIEVHAAVFTEAGMFPMITGLAESAYEAGAITREQTDTWLAEQSDRAAAGRLLLAIPLFLAAGTRP